MEVVRVTASLTTAKFSCTMNITIISGPIGSGKTSLALALMGSCLSKTRKTSIKTRMDIAAVNLARSRSGFVHVGRAALVEVHTPRSLDAPQLAGFDDLFIVCNLCVIYPGDLPPSLAYGAQVREVTVRRAS